MRFTRRKADVFALAYLQSEDWNGAQQQGKPLTNTILMSDDKGTESNKNQAQPETVHKHVVGAVSTIAGCALVTFILGALWSSPWPAAVASCGLCVMGLGVAFFMTRRG
jgi:hypothetical protein